MASRRPIYLDPASGRLTTVGVPDVVDPAVAGKLYRRIEVTGNLVWPSPVPGSGINNAIDLNVVELVVTPAFDCDVEILLNAAMQSSAFGVISRIGLIDVLALTAGATMTQALVGSLAPTQGLAAAAYNGVVTNDGLVVTGMRSLVAGTTYTYRLYAWWSGTAPAVGAVMCPAGDMPISASLKALG